MSYSIQTNVDSIRAQENLRVNGEFQSRTINRLTSGYRINSSRDDAAGLAVANKFRGDITELNQGVRNANDAISSLEIVDGGLNNISQMLDRLRTLATQSSSASFSGSRATLNTEYQTLLTEINRQASNIGLSTGAVGGRYSKSIDVYIGGGSGLQSNATATVDLKGARVDATGLSIASSNILGGGALAVTGSADLRTGLFLSGTTSDTITFQFAGGVTKAVQVKGTVSGISGTEILAQINGAVESYGVSAQINSSTGALEFYGDQTAFNFSVGGAGTAPLVSAATTGINQNVYHTTGATLIGGMSAGSTVITVAGKTYSASIVAGDITAGIATVAKKLNNAFSAAGVYAVLDTAGTHIELQSASDFAVTTDGSAIIGSTPATATAGSTVSTYSATSNATSALAAITNAVTTLGNVQGKVGTGQNQLQYAVQLAQSQIASFSAGESRIRDADIAAEAANLTKAQVLQQSSLAAMSQANSAPQAVMALLRG